MSLERNVAKVKTKIELADLFGFHQMNTVKVTINVRYVFPQKYVEIKLLSGSSVTRHKAIRGVGSAPQPNSDRNEARESAVRGTCVRRRDRQILHPAPAARLHLPTEPTALASRPPHDKNTRIILKNQRIQKKQCFHHSQFYQPLPVQWFKVASADDPG